MRVDSAVIAVLTVAALALITACTSNRDATPPTPTAGPPTTTVPQSPPTVRPYCQAALRTDWQDMIGGSVVDTGGVSATPLAVGPAGEGAAGPHNRDNRDLLLLRAANPGAE